MMKYIILTLVLLWHCLTFAQKYQTRTGLTEFKASVETFEPVEAKNKSTSVLLNAATGELGAIIFIKAFRFKVALMEEHFNENYMESDQFPKATFKGNITDFELSNLDSEVKTYRVKGILTIRNQPKAITFETQLKLNHNTIRAEGEFEVQPADFNIKIPKIVRKKIARTTKISFNYELKTL